MIDQHTDNDTPVAVGSLARGWTGDFLTGYHDALGWLKTGPTRGEAREILDVYKRRQESDEAAESTYFIDADRLPTFVTYVREVVEVIDGPAYKAELVRQHESFKAWKPTARMVAWPGAHPWFEGFELAVAHVLDES